MNARGLLARGEDQFLHRDYESAITTFKEVAMFSPLPEGTERAESADLKVRAQLGLGRAYLELADYEKALNVLYLARKACPQGPLSGSIDLAIGETFFRNGDYYMASSHLKKVLDRLPGPERDRILILLHIGALRLQNPELAGHYLSRVSKPLAPELRRLLDEQLSSHRVTARPPFDRAPLRKAYSKGEESSEPPEELGPLNPAKILPRSRWQARPILPNIEKMGLISRLTIHHTGGPLIWSNSASETANEILKIQRVHQRANGWADIGYHFIVDRAGRIWEGRPLQYQGAHARGHANRGNIGIVLLGNYSRQKVTSPQARTLQQFLAALCKKYRIPSHRVFTHSEILNGETECPGAEVSRLIHSFRNSGLAVNE